MTKLPNGHYRTRTGSTVEVYGEHSGCVRVSFDWFEEPNACCDCVVEPYPKDWGDGTHRLTWRCDHCGGGSAALEPNPAAELPAQDETEHFERKLPLKGTICVMPATVA